MNVFSEIEIEALVEEMHVSNSADVFDTGDMMVQEAELEVLTTFLDGPQSFDAFEPEWMDSAADVTQGIDADAGDWLTAFFDGDAESDTTTADKPKVNYTEDIDEVVSTGTINTSWDYQDILDFLATIESIGDGTLGDGGDNIGLGDDAPAVGAPIDEVIVTETIVRDGVEWEIPFGFEIMNVGNPNDPYLINPSTNEILLSPWYVEQIQVDIENYDWVGFWTTLIIIASGSVSVVGGVVSQVAAIVGSSAALVDAGNGSH